MLEMFILGAIQGIAEWIPISSEGMIVLAKTHFFGGGRVDDMVRLALFLHAGTTAAAIIYFRKEIGTLLHDLFSFRTATEAHRRKLLFYVIAVGNSGTLGFVLIKLVERMDWIFTLYAMLFTVVVGLALCVTGILQIVRHAKTKERMESDVTVGDGVLFGFLQGIAVIPGISRSGTTIAGLLSRGYKDEEALRISFMLSIPIVVAGNLLLNLKMFVWDPNMMVGLLTSFIVGIITINGLLRLARKVPFGPFVLFFGVLVIISAFI